MGHCKVLKGSFRPLPWNVSSLEENKDPVALLCVYRWGKHARQHSTYCYIDLLSLDDGATWQIKGIIHGGGTCCILSPFLDLSKDLWTVVTANFKKRKKSHCYPVVSTLGFFFNVLKVFTITQQYQPSSILPPARNSNETLISIEGTSSLARRLPTGDIKAESLSDILQFITRYGLKSHITKSTIPHWIVLFF